MADRGCDGAVLPMMCSVQRPDATLPYPVAGPPTWPPMDEAAIRDLTTDHWRLLLMTGEHFEELYGRRQRQLIAQVVARRARWAELMDDMRHDLGAN